MIQNSLAYSGYARGNGGKALRRRLDIHDTKSFFVLRIIHNRHDKKIRLAVSDKNLFIRGLRIKMNDVFQIFCDDKCFQGCCFRSIAIDIIRKRKNSFFTQSFKRF
ncbi:TPA: hypothetical protein DEP34_01580 [Candidatus Uhrbacteria bacterium]|nr:hypothetical protein [Candidatus Uhrbacteria bacterium]